MKVVFFGTPWFAAELLKGLLDKGINIVAVVTKPDKMQGRSNKVVPSAVKEMVMQHAPKIPVFQPEIVSTEAFAPTLATFEADLFLVVAYGEIIKKHLLEMPKYGCINVHGSLLPKYRGAAPIQHAIINGDKESGVTITKMVRKMDAGAILRTVQMPVGENMTFGELREQLCYASLEPLYAVIQDYERGEIPLHIPQDDSQATMAPKIELEDCEIDWRKSAQEIHNLVRGVNPEPGAWCYVTFKGEKKRFKVYRSELVPSVQASPGTVVKCNKEGLIIACGQGGIHLLELQMEGKRQMTGKEFACGLQPGTLLFS